MYSAPVCLKSPPVMFVDWFRARRSCKRVPKKLNSLGEIFSSLGRVSSPTEASSSRTFLACNLFRLSEHSLNLLFFPRFWHENKNNKFNKTWFVFSVASSVSHAEWRTALTRRNVRDRERFRNKFRCDNFRFLSSTIVSLLLWPRLKGLLKLTSIEKLFHARRLIAKLFNHD